MDLFIDYTKHPELKTLTECYRITEGLMTKVEEALAIVQKKKRERLPWSQANIIKIDYRQRERAYEVAYLKMELENYELHSAILRLIDITELVAEKAERKDGEDRSFNYDVYPIARNNVVCARDLIEATTQLYYRITIRPPERATTAKYHFSINDAFKKKPDRGRYYFVESSGRSYNFPPGEDTCPDSTYSSRAIDITVRSPEELPSPPYMTEDEAIREKDSQEIEFSTIGGSFRIRDLRMLEQQLDLKFLRTKTKPDSNLD